MRCNYCENLTLDKLLELARLEIEKNTPHHFRDRYSRGWGSEIFPQDSYYSHHSSYSQLHTSSEDGCEICQIFYSQFEGRPTDVSAPDGSAWPTLGHLFRDNEAKGIPTDIRVAIDSHNFTWRNNEQLDITVLDCFMVQVGRHQDLLHHPALEFALTVPRVPTDSSKSKISRLRIGRFVVEQNLASETNFELAREWLKQCISGHPKCRHSSAPRNVPTRLIDVGLPDLSKIPSIYLTESKVIEESEPYLTLSHCWGGMVALTLIRSNYSSLKSGISWHDLPANFQDAITITQQLGIRYLWIDSLCIIQDSLEDWEEESRKMSEVYRSALLTIAASRADGPESGILTRHGCGWNVPKVLFSIKMEDSDGAETFAYASDKERRYPEGLVDLLETGSLSRRGWALQERVLSPRILHYDSKMIYWQCSEENIAADGTIEAGHPMQKETFPILNSYLQLSDLNNIEQHSEEEMQSLYTEWHSIVAVYTRRNLTRASDKLPAVSGIASIFQRMTCANYLAGIWDADIHRGLLWQLPLDVSSRRITKSKSDRKPSWSWVSTEGETKVQPDWYIENLRNSDPNNVQLLSYNIDLVNDDNPFGEVVSGKIEVRGLVRRVIPFQKHMNPVITRSYLNTDLKLYLDHAEKDKAFNYSAVPETLDGGEVVYVTVPVHYQPLMDEQLEEKTADVLSGNCVVLLILNFVGERYSCENEFYGRGKCTDIDGFALVIAEVPGEPGVYERIGTANVEVEGRLHEQSRASYWTKRTLTLV